MSEEKKFEENPSPAKDLPQAVPEEVNEENQSQITNPTSEIPNMEVHHHPDLHHKRKHFKEYFLEFLMIFLAVTMGFFAETIRENISDREREKEFMRSLIKDIRDDVSIINVQQKTHEQKVVLLDSLIDVLNASPLPASTNNLYYYARLATKSDVFPNNTRTIDQMKNAGGFRVIKNDEVANNIMSYYSIIPQIRSWEETEAGEDNEYRKIAVQIFSAVVFNRINSTNEVIRPGDNPPLRTTDKKLLGDLAGWVHYIKNTRIGLYSHKKRVLENGEKLIELIQKEYHLEKE